MKKNFLIALILTIISFLLVIVSIGLQVFDYMNYCVYCGMAATVVAFFAVIFGVNTWKDK